MHLLAPPPPTEAPQYPLPPPTGTLSPQHTRLDLKKGELSDCRMPGCSPRVQSHSLRDHAGHSISERGKGRQSRTVSAQKNIEKKGGKAEWETKGVRYSSPLSKTESSQPLSNKGHERQRETNTFPPSGQERRERKQDRLNQRKGRQRKVASAHKSVGGQREAKQSP